MGHARAVPRARNNTECLYCNKIIRGGGITRLKHHLAGILDDVEACKKVPEDVKWQMNELLNEMKKSKEKRRTIRSEIGCDIDLISDDIDDRNSMEGQSQLSKAIDAMTAIGPGFKGQSLYELRGNLLKMAVNEVQDYLQQIKKIWNETGCSLMADGWTNQKQQSIINFLVYCPKGTIFLKSVDTSGFRKDAETLFNIFDEVVQEIGAENLVQFITDSDKELRQMFTCDKWIASSHSKSSIGKEIAEIVLEDKEFWVQCQFIVKVSEPLVRVLRLVDGDEKLAMGYLYDAMERAKENIKARCNNKLHGGPNLVARFQRFKGLLFEY
ncbi:uncharacterized protein LOC118349677 [Juglans regia]|uniref:Uncharacterized protein LOC118349677 n=1 Tax=Juglans regia TaxID=51240 RepID=A0A6P9F5B6_JUGRE|nr:uncharacterized protein LOC118349677 [Juglans regia]